VPAPYQAQMVRMWETSENLHRAELTKIERAELIEEWRELRVAQVAPPCLSASTLQRDWLVPVPSRDVLRFYCASTQSSGISSILRLSW
jgi:hypothetical protein